MFMSVHNLIELSVHNKFADGWLSKWFFISVKRYVFHFTSCLFFRDGVIKIWTLGEDAKYTSRHSFEVFL